VSPQARRRRSPVLMTRALVSAVPRRVAPRGAAGSTPRQDMGVVEATDDHTIIDSGRRLTFRHLWCCGLLLSFKTFIWPVDHREAFRRAIGAANGNAEVQAHVLRILETWMLVGALTAAFVAALASCSSERGDEQSSLFDQLQMIACICCAAAAFCGPVITGSVLYINASATSVENFDLFLVASQSASQFNEMLIIIMSYSVTGSLCLSIPQLIADPALMPSKSEVVAGPWFCCSFAALVLLIAIYTIVEINTLSTISMHSGIFSRKRACNLTLWTQQGGLTCSKLLLDRLVRNCLNHKSEDEIIRELARLRFEHERSSITQARARRSSGSSDVTVAESISDEMSRQHRSSPVRQRSLSSLRAMSTSKNVTDDAVATDIDKEVAEEGVAACFVR